MPQKKRVLGTIIGIGLLVCVLIVVLGRPFGSTARTAPSPAPSLAGNGPVPVVVPKTKAAVPEKPDLELLSSSFKKGANGTHSIAGQIRSNASSTIAYVEVEITLYDRSGAPCGSTLATFNKLEPGTTRRFSTVVLDDKVAGCEIKDVIGFS